MTVLELIPCGCKQNAPAISGRFKPIISLLKLSMDHVYLEDVIPPSMRHESFGPIEYRCKSGEAW